MKLSKLTKMAAFALESQDGGDETAAPELYAFCLANVDALVEALSRTSEVIRLSLESCDRAQFPRLLLKECRADKIREAARDSARDRKEAAVTAAASSFVETARLEGDAYVFDGSALASMAKIAMPTDIFLLCIDGNDCGLQVPARALKALDRIRPLANCDVRMTSHMTMPSFVVRWSDRGYYRSRIVETLNAEMVPVIVPATADMVNRERSAA